MTAAARTDEDAIRRVLADYCHFVDDRDHDRWIQLFADDATVVVGKQQMTGREEILGWIRSVAAASQQPTRHLCVNSAIDVDGDEATSLSDWMLVQAGPSVLQVGRYEDRLRRSHGGWQLTRRAVTFLRPNKAAS